MHYIRISLALGLLLAVAGCKKEDETTPYFFSAKINGMDYKASDISFSKNSSSINYSVIRGAIGNDYINITLNNYTGGTGTYPITFAPVSATVRRGSLISYALYGTLVVNTGAPTISGTFSFTCTDSTRITEGAFSLASD